MVQLDRGDSIDALWAQTVEEKEQGDNIDMLWEQMKSDSPGSRQGKTNEFASDTLPNPFELYLHWQTCLTAADWTHLDSLRLTFGFPWSLGLTWSHFAGERERDGVVEYRGKDKGLGMNT